MKRIGLRGRLCVVVTIGAAVALAALTVGFNLILRSNLDHDANQVLAARGAATVATVEVDRGTVKRSEAPDGATADTLVWVYSHNGAVEAPRAGRGLQRAASRLAQGSSGYAEDANADVRLLAQPVVRGGERIGSVVVGVSLEPYERSAAQALVGSALFAGVILLLIVVATWLVIGAALRPVARMTEEAGDWSEHDLDHRFHAGEPNDELTRLAATFDSMLDGLAASLRHERRFSAEVSHELRTPLAAILAEAEFALRREREPSAYRDALQMIADRAAQLQRILETLLAAERAGSARLGTADAGGVAERARDAGAADAEERGVELVVVADNRDLRIGADADAAERVLAPLVENACRYAQSWVQLRVGGNDERVEFLVADDGPGVGAGEAEEIFEPGVRGEAGGSVNGAGGAGLGLSLSRRLARALDGDVRYASERRAFVFEVPRG